MKVLGINAVFHDPDATRFRAVHYGATAQKRVSNQADHRQHKQKNSHGQSPDDTFRPPAHEHKSS